MAAKHALLIANRSSRQGRTDLSGAVERLTGAGWQVEQVQPRGRAAAAEQIRTAAVRHDCVILAGGDGTLHHAIEPLLHSGLPLGILPLGTANDLARSLALPRDPLAAAEVIAAGLTHRVDLGCVNGCYFFNAASIGLGVAVTRELSRGGGKRRWGVFSYARALLKVIGRRRGFGVQIQTEAGAERLRSLQVTVGNGRYYGGGMTMTRNARVDDGRLFLYSIEPQSPWRLLRLLPALRSGEQGDYPGVIVRCGQRLRVQTSRPMKITADGEFCARTPADFQVKPAAIPVFVPSAYAECLAGRRHDTQ